MPVVIQINILQNRTLRIIHVSLRRSIGMGNRNITQRSAPTETTTGINRCYITAAAHVVYAVGKTSWNIIQITPVRTPGIDSIG